MAADNRRTDNEQLLQLAINSAKSGQEDGARVMFRQVYSRDRHNETAMMWLAKIARTQEERKQWLQRILDTNPDNDAAKKALARMEYKSAAVDNRTLVFFGIIAALMIILFFAILLIVLL